MNRQEKIEQQTFVFYETCSDEDVAKSKGFIDGAKWADKTMIEKACKWLEEHVREYKYYDPDFADGNIDVDDLVDTFKKAMIEE